MSQSYNNKLTEFLSTTNGRLVASLVREFLEFFDLNFTMAVFDPETNIGKEGEKISLIVTDLEYFQEKISSTESEANCTRL